MSAMEKFGPSRGRRQGHAARKPYAPPTLTCLGQLEEDDPRRVAFENAAPRKPG